MLGKFNAACTMYSSTY